MPQLTMPCCESPQYPWSQEAAFRVDDYAYARTRTRHYGRSRHLERGYEIAVHFAEEIKGRRKEDIGAIERRFREHTQLWWKETRILSSIQAKIYNPHYQRIIGMGREVLPFIFAYLRDHGGHWYWALECISGDNPAAEAQTLPEAKRLWLDYASRHGYL